MSLEITSRQSEDVTILDLVGRITLGEGARKFRDEIRANLSKGNTKLLLNLLDVSYIDPSGIGELVSGLTETENKGGQLQQRVKDLLQLTKLYALFTTFDDEAAAIRSFGPSRPLPSQMPSTSATPT